MKTHLLRKSLFYLSFVLLGFLLTAHRTVEGPTNHLYTATWSAAAADPGCGAAFLEALNKNPELAAWFNKLPDETAKEDAIKAWNLIEESDLSYDIKCLDFIKELPKERPFDKWVFKVVNGKVLIYKEVRNNKLQELGELLKGGQPLVRKGMKTNIGLVTNEIRPILPVTDARSNLSFSEVKFSQSSISNHTGTVEEGYFVLKNAKEYLEGTLTKSILGAVRVYKNRDGNIWTLDHRRLAVYKLASEENIPVKWATKYEIVNDGFKMTTNDGGQTMQIRMFFGEDGKFTHQNDASQIVEQGEPWTLAVEGGKYVVKDGEGEILDLLSDLDQFL